MPIKNMSSFLSVFKYFGCLPPNHTQFEYRTFNQLIIIHTILEVFISLDGRLRNIQRFVE